MPTRPIALLLLSLPLFACGGRFDGVPADGGSDSPSDAPAPPSDGGRNDPPPPASKLDLLFMIDNSSSMADKQELFRRAVPDMVERLVRPNCVDPADARKVLGRSLDGKCAAGVLEFKPVHDLHVGIVTSALGGRGSDACPPDGRNPVDGTLNRHNDDRGHLVNRSGAREVAVPDANPSNFLAWLPNVPDNQGRPAPPVTALGDSAALTARFQELVSGVHEFGCGFEAQLESWYRFLVQPDPYERIERSGARAQLVGVDETILQQRRDFLRPDSAVAVVLLTDENDSTVDPLALGGQAWAYMHGSFPSSTTQLAPRGSAECAISPMHPGCTSCAWVTCAGGAYYTTPAEDALNVRFFQMKRRFGVDPQFPISRYVNALTQARVPNRDGEHPPENGAPSPNYVGTANCTNPLFATDLPVSATANLCNLKEGPREPSQVFFAVIAGVPHALLAADTSNPASSGLKPDLGAADWERMLGRDPLRYDFGGADPHMLESITPRSGLPAPNASNTADAIHGREWTTNGNELQYACTFPLVAPKDCVLAQNQFSCDCDGVNDSPTCDPSRKTMQLRGKAYPSIRELSVARELAKVQPNNVVISSICPIRVVEREAGDPLWGYRPAMGALIDRLRAALVR